MAKKKAVSSTKKTSSSEAKVATTVSTSVDTSKSPIKKYQMWSKNYNKRPNVSAALAEFLGTFLLTIAFLEMQSSPLFVAFAVAGVIFIVGGVSGAHINPAVTIAAWVTNKIKGKAAFYYIVGQCLGAGAGWLVAHSFLTSASSSSSTMSSSLLHAGSITSGKEGYLFLVELLGTFILSLGFAIVIRSKRNKTVAAFTGAFATLIALYVAMSLSTVLLTASYTSLTFLNPALALAAGGLSFSWWPIAIFIIAPILGSFVAFVIDDFLHSREQECTCDECEK